MESKTSKKASKPRRRRKKNKDKEKYYVNAKDFLAQITEYYDQPTDSNERILGESIKKIATGLSYAPNFINYSYKDEMIGDAVVKMFTALFNKKFNLEATDSNGKKYNPFSYFTTIAFHAFINRIKKEKRHHEALNEYKERVYEEALNSSDEAEQKVYVKPVSEDDIFD